MELQQLKDAVRDQLYELTTADFRKVCMLYPRFKAETPLQFVDKIGDDEKSLNGVLKLVNKQLEGY